MRIQLRESIVIRVESFGDILDQHRVEQQFDSDVSQKARLMSLRQQLTKVHGKGGAELRKTLSLMKPTIVRVMLHYTASQGG